MLTARISQDEYDSLTEADQAHYKAVDGGHYLLEVKASGGLELVEVEKLNRAIKVERSRADDATAKLDRWSKVLGSEADPEDVRGQLTEFEKLKANEPDREKQIAERVKTQVDEINRKAESQIKELRATNDKLLDENDRAYRGREIESAMAKKGVVNSLLRLALDQRTRLARTDSGERAVRVLAKDGSEMFNNSGDRATVDDLITELENDPEAAPLFPASGNSGTGGQYRGDSTSRSAGNGAVRKVPRDRSHLYAKEIASGRAVIAD